MINWIKPVNRPLANDPPFPLVGTPEIGGLTPIQALEIIRGCRGLNLVGCDLVEVLLDLPRFLDIILYRMF